MVIVPQSEAQLGQIGRAVVVTVGVEEHAASEQGMLINLVTVFGEATLQSGVDSHNASIGQWSVLISMRTLVPLSRTYKHQ